MEQKQLINYMITIVKNFPKFVKLLTENIKNKNILIVSHINPDPDTLGSQIALWYIFKNIAKASKIHLYNKDIKNEKTLSKFLPEIKYINNFLPLKFYDVIIGLEPSSFERLGLKNIAFNKLFIIDHHLSFNAQSFENFNSYIYFDPKADSCTQIIYQIAKRNKLQLDLKIKKAILIGILSDTLFFRYAKNKEIFKVIYEIFDKNLKMRDIYKVLFNFEIKDKKIIEKVLTKIKFYKNKKTALIDLSDFKIDKEKRGIFYEILRCFHNIDIYIFIVKVKNQYEFHLRSDAFDVSKIAKKFKGGGHKNASAFTTSNNKNKVIKEILREIK